MDHELSQLSAHFDNDYLADLSAEAFTKFALRRREAGAEFKHIAPHRSTLIPMDRVVALAVDFPRRAVREAPPCWSLRSTASCCST